MTELRNSQRIDPATLRSRLEYNPDTGLITWRWRDDVDLRWNAKWAGKIAGTRAKGMIGIRITVGTRTFKVAAHHIAWVLHTGSWPEDIVDHEDGDPYNNRIANLRIANNTQNMQNRTVPSGKYPFKGVLKCREKCRAQIVVGGKPKHLGSFDDPIEAAKAYDNAAILHYGEFAKTNKALGLI